MDPSRHSEADPGDLGACKPNPAAEPAVRASDTDRARSVAALQDAAVDGRISVEELDERLGLVYRAGSTSELATIVKDLQPARWANSTPTSIKDLCVFADFVRDGPWVVGNTYHATTIISSGVIDLREAQFTGPKTTVHVNSWIATVYVIVPANVGVYVGGTGVLGSFKRERERADFSTSHQITVTGIAVVGTVHVVSELPQSRQRRLQGREMKRVKR